MSIWFEVVGSLLKLPNVAFGVVNVTGDHRTGVLGVSKSCHDSCLKMVRVRVFPLCLEVSGRAECIDTAPIQAYEESNRSWESKRRASGAGSVYKYNKRTSMCRCKSTVCISGLECSKFEV